MALFAITISDITVIKAENISHITPSVIHKILQVNIQSSALKIMKLSYLVGSVHRKAYIST